MLVDHGGGQQGEERGEQKAKALNDQSDLWGTLHGTGSFLFLIVQDMFFNSFFVCVGIGTKSEFLSEG